MLTEGIAINPRGDRLYVASLGALGTRDGEVRGFRIDTDGRLTEMEHVRAGIDPVDMAFGVDGKHLYVSDFSAHTVTVFGVDPHGKLRHVQTPPSQGRNPAAQSVTVQPQQR